MSPLSNVIVADPRDKYWFHRCRTAEERVETLIRERDDQGAGALVGMLFFAAIGLVFGFALGWLTRGWLS